MSRSTPKQKAALDVLDCLYFNQILVLAVFSQDDLNWLAQIVSRVDDRVQKSGATGLKAECLKHCVLCTLEISLADNYETFGRGVGVPYLPPEIATQNSAHAHEYNKSYFGALLLARCKDARGDSMAPAFAIAKDLLPEFCNAPVSVRYRLTERCLAYEFKTAPLDFVAWLASLRVISSKRYPSDRIAVTPCDPVIARIGLLCEFEVIRKLFGKTVGSSNPAEVVLKNWKNELSPRAKGLFLEDKQQAEKLGYSHCSSPLYFLVDRGGDAKYVANFFTLLNKLYRRVRIFKSTQAGWLGALGAVMVEQEKSCNRVTRTVYRADNNAGTITDDIARRLSDRGFSINSQGLNRCYRAFTRDTLRVVQHYYTRLEKVGAALPAENDDIFLYIVVMAYDVVTEQKHRSSAEAIYGKHIRY